jgi:16S rRNA (guanine1207-N2)-methyltransferase
MSEDVYYKKTLSFNAWKKSLKFKTSQELFSSHDIDTGTRLLLRTIVESGYHLRSKILDLGCGYGPLGLTLKSLNPESQVHLVDKDALALEYSRQNAELNEIRGVEVYGSLGFDDLKQNDFDLLVSNIPGKAGEPVIKYLLQEAGFYLAPGGIVAVVVVSPLAETVRKILRELDTIKIIHERSGPEHTVFHYEFAPGTGLSRPEKSAYERGIYTRKKLNGTYKKLDFSMQTAYGLPEFDSLSYTSELLIDSLLNLKGLTVSQAAVYNPGQGYIPVELSKIFHPENLFLLDRDLLALRYSNLNLILNGFSSEQIRISHQVGSRAVSDQKIDLFAITLREEEGHRANYADIQQANEMLSPWGSILVVSGSTAITRLVGKIKEDRLLRIRSREKFKRHSLLIMDHGH